MSDVPVLHAWMDWIAAGLLLLGSLLGLFLIRRYLRCRRALEALRREREVMFGFVHDVAEVFSESDDVATDELLEKVLFYALRTSGAAAGTVYLKEPDGLHLRARAVCGVAPPILMTVEKAPQGEGSLSAAVERIVRAERIRIGEGPVGEVARLGSARLIRDAERDPAVPRHGPAPLRIRSLIAVPMRFHQRVMGVLVAVNRVDGQPFTPSDLDLLQALADQASVSLHYSLLREELDAKRRLDHDLAVARRIQQALLPRELPRRPGIEVAAINRPAQQVGGDYYDVIEVDDRHVGLAIADVSGKGVSGALLMSVCRSVLRAIAPGCTSPAKVLCGLNRVVSADLGEEMFITAVYMVLDVSTGRLSVARAGHDAPVLFRPSERGLTRLDPPGVAIGLGGPDLFESALEELNVEIQPGDLWVMYTDGLTEAQDDEGQMFGEDRALETVVLAGALGPHSVVAALEDRVRRFCGGHPLDDDLTILAARYTGPEDLGSSAVR
jgi:sigma-B regulation protein RsbU (phosphoserine phosphatase)